MSTDSRMINLKLFAADGTLQDQEPFIPIFHRWIRDGVLDGVLIDVADYRHVHHGPGVMLIAHDANFALDEAEGKPGLLYAAKRHVSGTLDEQVRLAFDASVHAARLLQQEETAQGVRFATSPILIRAHNRLFTGTTPAEQQTFHQQLRDAIERIFPEQFEYAPTANGRAPLGAWLTKRAAGELEDLQSRLEQ